MDSRNYAKTQEKRANILLIPLKNISFEEMEKRRFDNELVRVIEERILKGLIRKEILGVITYEQRKHLCELESKHPMNAKLARLIVQEEVLEELATIPILELSKLNYSLDGIKNSINDKIIPKPKEKNILEERILNELIREKRSLSITRRPI